MKDRTVDVENIHYVSKGQVKVSKPVRGVKAFLKENFDLLKPGNMINLGHYTSVDQYLSPPLAFYVDFDWQEIFADHPGAKVLAGNKLLIENAQPEDLEKLMNLPGFRSSIYQIRVDDLLYGLDTSGKKRQNELSGVQLISVVFR